MGAQTAGDLTAKYLDGIPADSRAAAGDYWSSGNVRRRLDTPGLLARLRRLNALALERGQTLAQMALAWTLRCPEITSVLIGASRVAQIEENVTALGHLRFSADELNRIDAILR